MEKPVIPVWIQILRFLPDKFFFGKKVRSSEVSLSFPSSTGSFGEFPNHLSITWCQAPCGNIFEKKCKVSRNLESNGTVQSDPFPWRRIVPFHLSKKFHRKFHSNTKRSRAFKIRNPWNFVPDITVWLVQFQKQNEDAAMSKKKCKANLTVKGKYLLFQSIFRVISFIRVLSRNCEKGDFTDFRHEDQYKRGCMAL